MLSGSQILLFLLNYFFLTLQSRRVIEYDFFLGGIKVCTQLEVLCEITFFFFCLSSFLFCSLAVEQNLKLPYMVQGIMIIFHLLKREESLTHCVQA